MNDISPLPATEFPAFDRAKWYLIVSAGSIALRFGPYDGPTIGQHMTRCADEGIQALVTGDCGPELDWESVRGMSAAAKEAPQNALPLLLTTARVLRAPIQDMQPTAAGPEDIAALSEALAPFDPSPGDPVNEASADPGAPDPIDHSQDHADFNPSRWGLPDAA